MGVCIKHGCKINNDGQYCPACDIGQTIKCDICGYDSELEDTRLNRQFIQTGNIWERWYIEEETGFITCSEC